jgi:hypothetical protein
MAARCAPWKPTSVFQDSLSCLNFNEPERPHPCNECLLYDLAPREFLGKKVPGHFILLNADGETVDTMERQYNQLELEEALKNWRRAKITKLEQERRAHKFNA